MLITSWRYVFKSLVFLFLCFVQDPTAKIGDGCRIGPNVVIGPGAVIQDGREFFVQ